MIQEKLKTSKPNFPQKPVQPQLPKAKKLVKGEFEKTVSFKARVQSEKEKRVKAIRAIEREYARKVKAYNAKVKKLTDDYNNAVALKRKHIKEITQHAMKRAYATVYGKPILKHLKYDADSERFYADVTSTQGDFHETVAINVPISRARNFQRNVANLKTAVIFDYKDNKLALKKIVVKSARRKYMAMLNDDAYKPKNIMVTINGGSLHLPQAPLLSTSLDVTQKDYDIGEINYSKDPEIARLQKQKFELERKVKAKKSSRKNREKVKALKAQIALLEQKSGGIDDIPQLLKHTASVKKDATKWLFIVAIENYDFTAPVAYSARSAKDFKAVMKKRLGIPEKHIRTLINEGATAGKIRYYMQNMLAHVKKGDTIYFYYSGHGVPVAKQGDAPYMLAQDISPAYVGNYKNFKLQKIYEDLSRSKASKVIAFIDSCFSGGADNIALFKGVAATRLKPKKVTFNKNKMVVISAGSGTQYSNKYDAKSNRLFSYYVMRGILKNNHNLLELYDYVKPKVQERSYEMGASYEQVPVYDGNIKMRL